MVKTIPAVESIPIVAIVVPCRNKHENRCHDGRYQKSVPGRFDRVFEFLLKDRNSEPDECRDYPQRSHDQRHCHIVDAYSLEEDDRDDKTDDHASEVLGGERFEEVCSSSSFISDIIANVVGYSGGVSRIIFWKVLFHFTNKVGADIG